MSSAPERRARRSAFAKTRGSGVNSGGHAIVRSRPASAATSSNEWATLSPPSPTNASRRPATSPNTSSIVSKSASAWHGWCSSERAFTTGTVAQCASSSTVSCANVRITIAETYPESERAVSAIDSPRPSCSSCVESVIGVAPSRAIAAANDTRVRVDGFSKMQAIASPRSSSSQRSGDAFIDEARSSNSRSSCCVKSATRVKFGETVWARMAPTPPFLSFDVVVALIVITPSRPSRGGRSSPG